MDLKAAVKKSLPVVDCLLLPLVYPSAMVLKMLRLLGVHRLPFCKKALSKVGVFPVKDHYYEPQFIFSGDLQRFSKERHLPGISWRSVEQVSFISQLGFAGELSGIPRTRQGAGEYFLSNGNFEAGDAEFLYQVVRHLKPKKIIEIGSGYSTLMAAMAVRKNREENASNTCSHTCVEPFEMPWLEKQGVNVIRKMVEDVGMDIFQSLEAGDMLFIDSSHMIRPEGDVLFEYLELLPQLKQGVLVHIHDIFSPRNYPKTWLVDEVRLWNEQYLLEAFLSNNREWEIVAGLNYLHHNYPSELKKICPYLTPECEPGSFYIRKIA